MDRPLRLGIVAQHAAYPVCMRFTEHEMTVGLAGAAKYLLSMQNRDVRRGKVNIDDLWNSLEKFGRFQILDSISDQVLPIMVALPDVEVKGGEKVTFTDEQIKATVEEHTGQVVGVLKRSATIRARIELIKAALAALPARQDPDGLFSVPDDFTVPDDLSGL